MINYLILVLLLFVNTENTLYSQWELRVKGLPEWEVADIFDVAKDSTILFHIRSSEVRPIPLSISNDLGNTWKNYNTPMKLPGEVSDAVVLDSNNIWYCTWNGKIFHSKNGGSDWILQYEDTLNYAFLNFIKFFDKNNGIVVGDAMNKSLPAPILKTTDGGINWVSVNEDYLIGVSSRDVFYPIEFPSNSVGYYFNGGRIRDQLYKTIDGGITWEQINYPEEVNHLNVIKFYNEEIGILVNLNFLDDAFVYRTIDGGKSWRKLPLITNSKLHDIEFLPYTPAKVWLSNKDNLFYSSDTGNTWQQVQVTTGSLEAHNIEFLNDSIGFVMCNNSKIFATENNGGIVTSVESIDRDITNDYKLYQNYPNPFNPSTKIKYAIAQYTHPSIPSREGKERSARGVSVKLVVYDVLGREVTTLVNDKQNAGNYEVIFDAVKYPSGVYFYQLKTGDYMNVKKMMLMK